MTAKGFILVQEAAAVCLLCLLCAATALIFARCLHLQQQNLALQRSLQTAEGAVAGEEITQFSGDVRFIDGQKDFLEVEVTDYGNRLTLIRALTAEEAERLSAAGGALQPAAGCSGTLGAAADD